MKLTHFPQQILEKEIMGIVSKFLDPKQYKVFYFGSRVSGKADENSDIDIGIEGPETIPLSVISQIKESVSNIPTLYTIDLVDFHAVPSDFAQIAKEKIEYLN